MNFKLSPELVDNIIFAMENQKDKFLFDTKNISVIPDNEQHKEDDDIIPIPVWQPVDGYQLMDSFTASLNNPVYREKLRDVLNAGVGVFRGFKNVLKERPDLERQWYLFKERAMKQRVNDWYAELCDFWEVAAEGIEPEELDDLIEESYSFEIDMEPSSSIFDLRSSCFDEILSSCHDELFQLRMMRHNWRDRDADYVLKAIDPLGNLVGILTGFKDQIGSSLFFDLDSLYVLPEFRGSGIALSLLEKWAKFAFESEATSLVAELPEGLSFMHPVMKRMGFKTELRSMSLGLSSWGFTS